MIEANIADENHLKNLVEKTNKLLGKIDVLVCNAASNPFMGSMQDIPSEAFDKIMNNNIKIPFTVEKYEDKNYAGYLPHLSAPTNSTRPM